MSISVLPAPKIVLSTQWALSDCLLNECMTFTILISVSVSNSDYLSQSLSFAESCGCLFSCLSVSCLEASVSRDPLFLFLSDLFLFVSSFLISLCFRISFSAFSLGICPFLSVLLFSLLLRLSFCLIPSLWFSRSLSAVSLYLCLILSISGVSLRYLSIFLRTSESLPLSLHLCIHGWALGQTLVGLWWEQHGD